MAKTNQILTDKDVLLVKTLLEAGLSPTKIRTVTGRGAGTIHLIGKSDGTLKDYHRVLTLSRKSAIEPEDDLAYLQAQVRDLSARVNKLEKIKPKKFF